MRARRVNIRGGGVGWRFHALTSSSELLNGFGQSLIYWLGGTTPCSLLLSVLFWSESPSVSFRLNYNLVCLLSQIAKQTLAYKWIMSTRTTLGNMHNLFLFK